MLNHQPPDAPPLTDTLMVPVLPSSTKTVSAPKVHPSPLVVTFCVTSFPLRNSV
jgi:hypothetical protein